MARDANVPRGGARERPGREPRRLRRVAAWTGGFLAASIVASLAAGAGAAQWAAAEDGRRAPPPGRLVDVGGHRLHLHCLGASAPTVVIDAGAGNWSIHWWRVQEVLAAEERTCTYDRGGLGWSEPGPRPRTSDRLARELHRLLQREAPGPYVLVGHSLGGFNARVYAAAYPGEVAGVVLVESAHERRWERLPPEVKAFLDESVARMRAAETLARFGLLRLVADRLPMPQLDPALRPLHRAAMMRPEWYRTMRSEAGRQEATTDQGPRH
jgi:pimeloyl-ACP methyl ester carboxylesterase